MAISYTQTDDTGSFGCIASELLGCSGLSGASDLQSTDLRACTVGGTPGVGASFINIGSSQTNVVEKAFACDVASGVSWDAGTWTIRLNITASNMNLTWSQVYVCRINSTCVNQETIGSNTAVNISLGTTGVKSTTVSGSAVTPSAGDKVLIVLAFTNGAMSSQNAQYTPDQDIDSPFTASSDITVTPSAGAVTYAGQTPVPFVLDPKTTSPGSGAVAYSGLAPTPGEQVIRTPGAGSVVYAGQASTLSVTQNVTTNPTAGAVVYAGQAPTEAVTANQFTSPGAGSVVYAGQPPTPGIGEVVQPPAGAIAYSGLAPTEAVTENQTVTPSAGTVVYSGQAPTEAVTANQFTSPGSGTVVYAGQQPVANTGASQTTQPDAGSVAYAGLAPLLAITADQITVPGAGSYTYSGLAPTEVVSGVDPEPEIPATTSGGGYYRYFSAEEMSCKREIKALEKKEKEVVRQVKKLEQKIDDKQDEIAYARNMATLQRMINELEALHKKLEFMRRKLEEIEEEEMMLIAFICGEYEQRVN